MCAHQAILHRTTHFFLHCVYKTFWTFLSLQNIYFKKGTAYLNLMRDLLLLLPRNIRDSSFDGDQRKHDLAASPSILLILDPWACSQYYPRHFCLFRIFYFSREWSYFVISPVGGWLYQLKIKVLDRGSRTSFYGHFYQDTGPIVIVNLNQVKFVIGQIYDRGKWAIVDRSTSVAQIYDTVWNIKSL